MTEAWQILRDGGMPLAIARSSHTRTPAEIAVAIRAAIAEQPSGREAEALAAFVLAWHQHWPASFATELGDDAKACVAWAARTITDDNRYLKLRRIALENLSRLL
jgi:hypothetical protein